MYLNKLGCLNFSGKQVIHHNHAFPRGQPYNRPGPAQTYTSKKDLNWKRSDSNPDLRIFQSTHQTQNAFSTQQHISTAYNAGGNRSAGKQTSDGSRWLEPMTSATGYFSDPELRKRLPTTQVSKTSSDCSIDPKSSERLQKAEKEIAELKLIIANSSRGKSSREGNASTKTVIETPLLEKQPSKPASLTFSSESSASKVAAVSQTSLSPLTCSSILKSSAQTKSPNAKSQYVNSSVSLGVVHTKSNTGSLYDNGGALTKVGSIEHNNGKNRTINTFTSITDEESRGVNNNIKTVPPFSYMPKFVSLSKYSLKRVRRSNSNENLILPSTSKTSTGIHSNVSPGQKNTRFIRTKFKVKRVPVNEYMRTDKDLERFFNEWIENQKEIFEHYRLLDYEERRRKIQSMLSKQSMFVDFKSSF